MISEKLLQDLFSLKKKTEEDKYWYKEEENVFSMTMVSTMGLQGIKRDMCLSPEKTS